MLIVLLSASLVWSSVLTFFVIKDYRLLAKVVRWSTTLYLIGFSLVIPEILRVGLVVNGQDRLQWNTLVAWAIWYSLTVLALIDWRFLVPAAVIPMWLLSRTETRILLNYGLARLGWLDAFYNPVWWVMTTRRGVLDSWLKIGYPATRLFGSTMKFGGQAIQYLTGASPQTEAIDIKLNETMAGISNGFSSNLFSFGRPFRI